MIIKILTALLFLFSSHFSIADKIFFDDFNDGVSGWSYSGSINLEDDYGLVPYSVRLGRDGVLTRSFSTVGWKDIEIGFFLGARSLEDFESCIVEISSDGGDQWDEVKSLSNGEDDAQMHWSLLSSPSYDNNPDLQIRYRANVSSYSYDHCYAEDVSINGLPNETLSCQDESLNNEIFSNYVYDFDPLVGDGTNIRFVLTSNILNGNSVPVSPVNSQFGFSLPPNAAPPIHQFNGKLELINESTSGEFLEIQDDYNYTDGDDDSRKHLPEFNFNFIQSGSHIIPERRGIIIGDHPEWEYIIEPGRVWSEVNDNGKTRAAIPFSLKQKNANCLHNGLMTFLFDDSSVSNVYYQITSETCAYYSFNMWGLLDAQYTPQLILNSTQIASEHQRHYSGRMPQKPISSLSTDYPGTDPNEFGSSEVPNLTIYGVIVDGTHYVGGCETRYGTHPYCDSLRVPSYSTSKTALASVGAMRLEKVYGNFFDQYISDLVPEAAADPQGDFFGVTVNNALDMATGNYSLSGYFDDESSNDSNGFFLPETHAEKMNFAVNQYPRQSTPGTQMHYHTSDTFLVMAAEQKFYRDQVGSCGDVFDDVIVEDVWKPLGFDLGSLSTSRTYDPIQQPVGGLGSTFLRDDVAKIGKFLGVDHGRINNVQILDSDQLAASKFGTASDPGLSWITTGLYNNSFWGLNKGTTAGCSGLFVPYMSGFGGISIVMAPSGVIYYYFSDGYSVTWNRAFAEAENIRSSCISSRPSAPTNLEVIDETEEGIILRWTPPSTPINVMRYRVFRDGQLLGITSGNEWLDNSFISDASSDYHVESLNIIGWTSIESAELSYQPITETVPTLNIYALFITGSLILLIGSFYKKTFRKLN